MGKLTDSLVVETGASTLERYSERVISYVKDHTAFTWDDYNPHSQATICHKGQYRFNIWLHNLHKVSNATLVGNTTEALVKVSLVCDSRALDSDYAIKGYFPECMRLEKLTYVVEHDGLALAQFVDKLHTGVMALAVENDDPADLLNEFDAWTPDVA